MKLEARHTMALGLALFTFGLIAYVWSQRNELTEQFKQKQSPGLQFARFRREEMISEEHDITDDAGA